MKTSKPFSTISYNTADYLTNKLDDLFQRRVIDFYAWIKHYPEEDESKEHKHLYIVPNGRVDTDQVLLYLIENDPQNPTRPFVCLRPRSSKFADWYLYALHDTAYLASKGQARKYHYGIADIVSADNDYLIEEIHQIDFAKINRLASLREAVTRGVSFEELLYNGSIPIQQTYAYRQAYDLMSHYKLQRDKNPTHTPLCDPITGEVISQLEYEQHHTTDDIDDFTE